MPDGLRVVKIATLHEARLDVAGDRRPADGATRCPTCGWPARHVVRRSLSVSRSVDQARARGPGRRRPPVVVVRALAQRAHRSAVAEHADEEPHVRRSGCAARCSTASLGVRRAGRARPPAARRSARRASATPSTLGRPGQPAEHRLQRGGRRQPVLLDGGQVRPGSGGAQLGGHAAGLARDQACGADQGEQPRRLVPADARDVPLGLEGGGPQAVRAARSVTPAHAAATVTPIREPQVQ